MYDLVLRGGLVVDGTGSREPFVGDVAVDRDTIVAIGRDVAGAGREEIDAHGLVVTPGFIDLHTHLDPYAFWKPEMNPSVHHGVTTAMMGNCSVSLAPCHPEHREFLCSLMEVVEEVPQATLMEHLPWTWTTYGEYLDALESCQPAINLCGLASLASLRLAVVGEDRCFDDSTTYTAEELEQIAALAADSVRGGAFGVSCIRNRAHRDKQGRPPPGNYADWSENRKICEAMSQVSPDAIWQTIPNMGAVAGRDEHDPGNPAQVYIRELQLLKELSSKGVRIIFSPGNFGKPGQPAAQDMSIAVATDDVMQDIKAAGGKIAAVNLPRCFAFNSGLEVGIRPSFSLGQYSKDEENGSWSTPSTPTWFKLLSEQSFQSRLAMIHDDVVAAALMDEASSTEEMRAKWGRWAHMNYWQADQRYARFALYSPDQEKWLVERLAKERDLQPWELWLELNRQQQGQTKFYEPFANQLKDVMEFHLRSNWCLPGLGDTGAHLSIIIDAGWPSFVLSHWHRETGFFTLQEAVRRLTSAPADAAGIRYRGRLEAGWKADINVIDLEAVGEELPYMVQDLPAGGRRLMQKSCGYICTIVNGRVVVQDGELTGNRSGCVLRRCDAEGQVARRARVDVPPEGFARL